MCGAVSQAMRCTLPVSRTSSPDRSDQFRPPARPRASRITQSHPARRSSHAATIPAIPAPRITTRRPRPGATAGAAIASGTGSTPIAAIVA